MKACCCTAKSLSCRMKNKKNAALRAFLAKYIPHPGERGEHFLQHAAPRTVVLQFRILAASGKANKG